MSSREQQTDAISLKTIINVTKIVSIHYFEFDKDFQFDGEAHNYWEIVYVDSGRVLISAENEAHVLKQGEIIFHKPNEFHTISADKITPSNVAVITFVTSSKLMSRFENMKTTVPKELRQYLKTIIYEGRKTFDLPFNDPQMEKLTFSSNPPLGGLQIIKISLEQLLIMLLREKISELSQKSTPFQTDIDVPLVNDIIQILNECVYGNITIEQICNDLSYSKTYISKIFKENCKCNIINYYTKLKITEAKKLIRKKHFTVSQISNMLCFSSPHYFSKVFKKVTNMTPSEYLNSVSQ